MKFVCVCAQTDLLFRQVVTWENNTGFEVLRGVPQTVDSLVVYHHPGLYITRDGNEEDDCHCLLLTTKQTAYSLW